MKIHVYNQKGDVVGEEELDPSVFGVAPKPAFLHDIVVALQANRRRSTAHTKQRGEVRGGGKKPWRQKGTGRARHGSIRSPLWRGGGVTFGPRNERTYTKKINTKARQRALRMCLSDKVMQKRLILVDSLDVPGKKTKEAHALLLQLKVPLEKRHSALVIVPKETVSVTRLLRNIPSVFTSRSNNLHVLDLLRYPYLVTTPEEAKKMTEIFKKKER